MKIKAKTVAYDTNNNLCLVEVPIENVRVNFPCILAIDGSTTNTGAAILRETDGAIISVISFKNDDESAVHYKVRLKRAIQELLRQNRVIKNIFYEEPFIEYVEAAYNLLMLRTFIQEIKVENEPEFNYIQYTEVNNKKWKRLFLAPDKCPNDSKLEKEAVKNKLIGALPWLSGITQDEIDAIAMGFVAVTKLKEGEEEELRSKKKARPFQYNIHFIGAEDEDVMMQEMFDFCKIPIDVLRNGIAIVELPPRCNFEQKIYDLMGQDDKLLILKFPSDRYGDVILKHQIGYLAASFSTLYAIIWRKTRKR